MFRTDVLLAHSNFMRSDLKQMRKQHPYPPLATLYASARLREAGYSVELFDATFADSFEDFKTVLDKCKPRFLVIYEDLFNFIAKMCLNQMRQAACIMARLAKDTGSVIIGAGPDINLYPELYLAKGVDYALVGEPDITLLELIEVLSNQQNRAVENVAGVIFSNLGGDLCFTGKRIPETNLDVFPFPAWDMVDSEAYRKIWLKHHGYFSLNMVTSRGCPYRCNWCSKPIWGNNYFQRSPGNVVKEMVFLKNTLKPDHIWFTDDVFCVKSDWLIEFEKEIKSHNLKITYAIQTRADLITEKNVASLSQSGCSEIWLGVESGSQKILDAMDKDLLVEQVYKALNWLKKTNIKTCLFFQFGYPGETFKDIQETIQMIRKTLPDSIGISVSYPLLGTKFYDMIKENLGEKTNWKDSNDMSMIFQGSYQTPFYHKLYQVLHKELEIRQRIALAGGKTTPKLLKEIDSLSNDWFELGRLEVIHRHKKKS